MRHVCLEMQSRPSCAYGCRVAASRRTVGSLTLGGGCVAAATYWAGFSTRSQIWGSFPHHGDEDRSEVALTFDDGPNEPHTSTVLDTLQDRAVAATFFQVGRCAERFPEVTRRLVAEGHVLGNHSYSHRFGSYAREPTQRREVERGRDALAAIAGVAPRLYRPPWLCHWPWVLRGVASSGSQVVSGKFGHPLELAQPPAPSIAAAAARRARGGTILILHDGREARGGDRSETAAAVGPLIDLLRQRGFGFTTVDGMLGYKPYA